MLSSYAEEGSDAVGQLAKKLVLDLDRVSKKSQDVDATKECLLRLCALFVQTSG